MNDRDALRNKVAFALATRARHLPELPTGRRSVVVVFANEPVGPVTRQIRADFAGHAHVVVLNEHSSDLAIITLSNTPTDDMNIQADLLTGSMTFGTLVHWLHDCHDGHSPITFTIDHENFGVAEAPIDPAVRRITVS